MVPVLRLRSERDEMVGVSGWGRSRLSRMGEKTSDSEVGVGFCWVAALARESNAFRLMVGSGCDERDVRREGAIVTRGSSEDGEPLGMRWEARVGGEEW